MGVEGVNDVATAGQQLATLLKAKEPARRAVAQQQEAKQAVTNAEVSQAIEQLIKDFGSNKSVRMYFDDGINRVVVTVMDDETQRVIRQIPAPEFIAFVRRFKECLGLLVERKV
jgi:flagellar protein FlaG